MNTAINPGLTGTFPGAFLGVARSMTGKIWMSRLEDAAERTAQALEQTHGLNAPIARILAARGVLPSTLEAYLAPSLAGLMPDPFCLTDMELLVERLLRALEDKEPCVCFGDYDVDGACASALFAEVFRALGGVVEVYIPDRILEGYGPNVPALEAFARKGAKLLICVDCGTMGFAPFARAKALGLDVVVIDHHQSEERLPQVAALVNPNRQDDVSGLGHLCATGVVFLALVALLRALREKSALPCRNLPDVRMGLDLVALATVADVVPLIGLNRAFVRQGLRIMGARARPGLAALMDVAQIAQSLTPYHLGFVLGPRINAGGRIGDASSGARLLLERDEARAMDMAMLLNRLNAERRALEAEQLEEAMAAAQDFVDGQKDAPDGVIVVAGETWHPGLLGLLASRLKERFLCPAFALAFQGDVGTGSGRGIEGVDLGAWVREAAKLGLIEKGGGHKLAAGLTVRRDRLDALRSFFGEQYRAQAPSGLATAALAIDAALDAGQLTAEFAKALAAIGPYGAGNPEPVLVLPSHTVTALGAFGDGHLRARLVSPTGAGVDLTAFGADGQPLGKALREAQGARVHIAGTLMTHVYKGREDVRLKAVDLAPLMP